MGKFYKGGEYLDVSPPLIGEQAEERFWSARTRARIHMVDQLFSQPCTTHRSQHSAAQLRPQLMYKVYIATSYSSEVCHRSSSSPAYLYCQHIQVTSVSNDSHFGNNFIPFALHLHVSRELETIKAHFGLSRSRSVGILRIGHISWSRI